MTRRERELLLRSAEATRWRGTRKGLEMALLLTFPDLPLRVEDEGGVVFTRDADSEPAPAANRFIVYCDKPIAAGRQSVVARVIEEQKPIHVKYRLRVKAPPRAEDEEMSACPSCGFGNPEDRDFCPKCGSYTRWDPTVVQVPAVPGRPAPPAGTGAAGGAGALQPIVTGVPAAVAEGVIVTVRKPGDDAADAPVELTLAPGAQATLAVTVRNQSGIVDNYDLELRGMPKDWWTMTPPTVYLVPYGAAGGSYEQEAVLRLHPPRSPEAEARRWPITIVARSRAREEDAGSATAAITLEPYVEIESELRPEIATGRHGAEFAIAVRNAANAPVNVVVGALDNEGECTFKFQKPQLTAPPGRRDGTAFHVRPPKQMIFGRMKERRFTVTAQAVGTEVAARPQPAVFRQKPWIPAWVLPIVPILIAAGIAVWLLRPNTTKVPDLTGATVFVAQQKLEAAGLKLGQKEPEETATGEPGTILATIPAAGKEVDKGKEVIVQVAVGSTEVEVPQLIGLSVQAAETRLKKAGLELGRIDPQFDDAAKAIVNHQAPDPGEKLNKGESVDLALNPETASTATTAATDTAATDTAGSTGTDTAGTAGTAPASTGGSADRDACGDARAGRPRRGRSHQQARLGRQDRASGGLRPGEEGR